MQQLVDLICKYDRQGPRYTSYPPAPVFSPEFTSKEYKEAILSREAEVRNPDLSLYVHFPFCDTLCYFCGCTTIITRQNGKIQDYLQFLKREIDLLRPLLHSERRVVQMHWGGGTPTFLTPLQIAEIGSYLRESFMFDRTAEVNVEVDPRDLTFHHLKALRDTGFNRISLGVQDFNPRVQDAVNRHQSEFVTRQAIDWSRELGFKSLNIDLIYGLPLQTVDSFSLTLDRIIEIAPERIAVYNFAYVPWLKKHQNLIHPEDLPSPETKVQILVKTIEKLTGAGYVYIGMDHFAKPDDEMAIAQRTKTLHRNFQGYSTKAGADLYGLGMSSISHFGATYAQNAKTLVEYSTAIDAAQFATTVGYQMTLDDQIRKFVIMKLMCDLSLRKKDVEEQFFVEFDHYFESSLYQLQPLVSDGLLHLTEDEIIVTAQGRLLLRNIAMCFDAYLAKSDKPLYSKTV